MDEGKAVEAARRIVERYARYREPGGTDALMVALGYLAAVERERGLRNATLEEAAKVAELACLMPPDGGAPHPMEVDVANAAARAIRALSSGQPEREDAT